MLLLSDLISFSDSYVASRPNLENRIVVASDDEVSKLYKDIANAGDTCTLIVVIPSHDSEVLDEDIKRLKNNLTFLVVKKTDSRAGNDEKIANFIIAQTEILELLKTLVGLAQNFGENCTFRDLDTTNMPITPVQDYFGANGYMLDAATRTKF